MNNSNSNSNLKGILFLITAILFISIQSVVVKWMGDGYPVLEMVVLRNIVALPITLIFFWREGNKGFPKTRNIKRQVIRGLFLFISYTTYMMALVALPLATVESIRFSGPLIITLLSIFMLKEKVSLSRWISLAIGFLGILLIVKPSGNSELNIGVVFVFLNVIFYAFTVIITRKLQVTDSSSSMSFFSSATYLVAALILVPITTSIGEIPDAPISIGFLLHPWKIPTLTDGIIMCSLGIIWAAWAYFMTLAYSYTQASLIVSFEYLSLPISSLWGFLFWNEIPMWTTWAGAGLILVSNLYILYRDSHKKSNINLN